MGKQIVVKRHCRYGRLVVISEAAQHVTSAGKRQRQFKCKCDCGNDVVVKLSDMRSGHTASCGCLHKEVVSKIGKNNLTHGMTDTPTWKTWKCMRDRCCCNGHGDYPNYGGRGITVCERWVHSFEAFYEDMGERPDGFTIERIDNDGNYEPSNCCWATRLQQGSNRRVNRVLVFNGQSMCMKEWALTVGINYTTLFHRIQHGWTTEKALMTPAKQYKAQIANTTNSEGPNSDVPFPQEN